MTHEPLSVALIGAGNFARHQHLPNLARIPECRIAAVCDVKADVLEEVGRRYGVRTTTDHRTILADPDVAAVVIAVRDDLQAPMAIEAMEAGKHVYVEKPLAKTAEVCERVVEARERTGRRLAVGFNRRYAPVYRRMREVVRAHGGPRNMHFRMADDAWRWAVGYEPGFLLKLDAGHLFDLARWLTGAEVAAVWAARSRPDDDCLMLRMTDGCVASIMLSGHGTMDMPKERTEVITERGGATATDFVELRTYGFADEPAVEAFAGHSHPDGEFLHMPLWGHQGLAALEAVRRVTWELRERVAAGLPADEPYAEEIRRYVARAIPNFMRDQGWLSALRAFVVGVATGAPTDHAGAEDALAAARVSDAAVLSREEQRIEEVR